MGYAYHAAMVKEASEPLTPAEAAKVDAQYKPFPAFSEWPQDVPRLDLWERDRKEFQAISASAVDKDLARAQEVAMRAAAFDSGAIEGLYSTDRGLTLTVATQAAAWEQAVDERSQDARALFEAQLAAFELVLDVVTDHFPNVSQAWIRRLHEEITAAQTTYKVQTPVGEQDQPLPKGQYKEHPNHVRTSDGHIHAYAPVDQTQAEMQRFLAELESPEFTNAHPVLQASYAHYAFVAIHPFADGNGRVARAIASAYTYRDMSVPLLVLAHQRDSYFSALASADSGNARQFVEFTASAVRDAIELVTESLKTAQAPNPEDLLDAFRKMLLVQGSLSHEQLDEVANDFANVFTEIAMEERKTLTLPDGVDIEIANVRGQNLSDPPAGFRPVVEPAGRLVEINFASVVSPAQGGCFVQVDVFVATGSDTDATLIAQVVSRTDEQIEDQLRFSLSDLQPQLSSVARYRVSNLIRRLFGNGLNALYARAQANLRNAGY